MNKKQVLIHGASVRLAWFRKTENNILLPTESLKRSLATITYRSLGRSIETQLKSG